MLHSTPPHVREDGTDAVLEWCDRTSEIGLSAIALPEIISAFYRLKRENRIVEAQYRQLKTLLLTDIEDAALCHLTPAVLVQAIATLETSPVRAVEAIEIAGIV